VDPDVAELVRQHRLADAAGLARERGDARTASTLYERACQWRDAAQEALRAGDTARALDLAVEAGDDTLAGQAVASIARSANAASAAALRLVRRGRPAWAARVLEAAGLEKDAAAAWVQAGDAVRAAQILDRLGETIAAARVLEDALRRDSGDADAAIVLGTLLARFGKHEAALRVLQRVEPGTARRREATSLMIGVLRRLGLSRAAHEAEMELASLGGAAGEAAVPEPGGTRDVPTPILFGRYEVVREVASSPNARVIECRDIVRNETVAVKAFASGSLHGAGRDALARFEREVRALRSLEHPNVVPIRDFVRDGPAIVLEWMPGPTLETLLANARLAPRRSIEIACAVLSALGEAHRLGILHRDVKPANVLFDASGTARLSDFGAAHLADASATTTAGVIGTRGYMSPEQRAGRAAIAQSDLFSVGVLLREMLVGDRSTFEDRGTRPSDAHPQLDARHDAVIDALTNDAPERRPADAFEARARLLAIPWPATIEPHAERLATKREVLDVLPPARLRRGSSGGWIDGWTDREVEYIPLTDRVLERARRFALADHPALQTLLRIDTAGALWLVAPRGRPLDRELKPPERRQIEAALASLHAAGEAHGYVDASHVLVDSEGGVMLRFEAEAPAAASPAADQDALARLVS
jgi:serine/threonine-protein kinase